ncbi:MAG: bifunctional ornithine acetyltransferase/N-acetylglutamate synthase [Oscillospiraceae bacterium]|nr:bifunctional ornithine acetyltransferase/N-acetylglutamate synthase [Oscillospiraceae bacterium]
MENIKFIDSGITAPLGFLAAGMHCGLRRSKEKKDLALIFSRDGKECAAAAVYTTNKVYGAPIEITRENLKNGTAKAVICNSGIANTCNPDGLEKAGLMAALTAQTLGISEGDIIIASTGVIGAPLPIEPIKNGLPKLKELLSDTKEAGEDAAIAIMTTDTRKKEYAVSFELDGKPARIGLIAKGSGMIEPNMATMLCFITTDVSINSGMLQQSLSDAVGVTFNMVSVDGDTSTNDMVSIMASGLCGNAEITEKNRDYTVFTDALRTICKKAARSIAFDGEGATKLLECTVEGCADVQEAKKLAKTVIKSALVKTMMYGADANCGRILCALGYAGVEFDPLKVDVRLKSAAGEILCYEKGCSLAFDEGKAKEILSLEIIEILIDMNSGDEKATAWGCDLSYEYVRINGDYRS